MRDTTKTRLAQAWLLVPTALLGYSAYCVPIFAQFLLFMGIVVLTTVSVAWLVTQSKKESLDEH